MPAQDTSNLKEKILSILEKRGPSLPVHIAKETGLSMLFASAFLSELLSEKKIKISNMKVGSSPIYFIPSQKLKLENFSHHLKSKEKDAFILLQEKKRLKDIEQEPAIRVALRAIKDFAIPFRKNEEIFWRYFSVSEEEQTNQKPAKTNNIQIKENAEQDEQRTENIEKQKEISDEIKEEEENPEKSKEQETEQLEKVEEDEKEEPPKKEEKSKEEKLDIFDSPKKEIKTLPKQNKTKPVKKKSTKQNEKLFSKVKEFLSQKNIEITDFQSLSKEELILKVKENEEEKLLIAYSKKRITELDLLKTYKKIEEINLPYILLTSGEAPKKLTNMIEAIKKMDSLRNLEENQ